jgi:hypothetical protein
MASIGPITLDPIDIEVANATVNVSFIVSFNSYDINSNQPYRMEVRLVGEDQAEGNADDPIVGGRLTPPILGQLVASDGLTSKSFAFEKTLPRANLNEDTPPEPNPDEIQVVVTLTPVLPTAVTRQSNVRTLVA